MGEGRELAGRERHVKLRQFRDAVFHLGRLVRGGWSFSSSSLFFLLIFSSSFLCCLPIWWVGLNWFGLLCFALASRFFSFPGGT